MTFNKSPKQDLLHHIKKFRQIYCNNLYNQNVRKKQSNFPIYKIIYSIP